MNVTKLVLGLAVTTAAIVAVNTRPVDATSSSCKIESVIKITSFSNVGQNFTINSDGTVTAQFKVTGDASCKKPAVLAVWNMPTADGQPLESQIFHDSAPKQATMYGPGVHKLTAKLPPCDYWQLDLLEGSDPKGFNGTANYGNMMHPIDNDPPLDAGHRRGMLDTKLGGQKKDCTPPKQDACPNIDGTQEAIPANHQKDSNGNCRIPELSNTPVVAAVRTPENGKLPSTGPADTAAIFAGASASAATAHAVISKLKRRISRR